MPETLLATLADIVGPAHCRAGADRGPFVVEGRTPCAVVFPGTADEVARVVGAAGARGVPIIPWGGGTQMALGAPPREGALVVVTRRLARLVEHEPGDLTATAEAGITMDALQAALGARGQWLPLDPPAPAQATLGGVLAANASGPRRHLYGTARDLVIGLRVVGADGAVVRPGGKVMKNVAGYDLAKLYIGARGTLGLIVEVTVKLRPRPEADRACWATFSGVEPAAMAGAAILASDLFPSAVELLDAGAVTALVAEMGLPGAGRGGLLLGFDGLPVTVAWQLDAAARQLTDAGATTVTPLDDAAALAVVRDLPLRVATPLAVARVSVLPAHAGGYLETAAHLVGPRGLRPVSVAHAGEGAITIVLTAAPGSAPDVAGIGGALAALREAAQTVGGALVVEVAPLGVKEAVPVWEPPGAAARLMQGIKARLDPAGLMNPGRFVGGL